MPPSVFGQTLVTGQPATTEPSGHPTVAGTPPIVPADAPLPVAGGAIASRPSVARSTVDTGEFLRQLAAIDAEIDPVWLSGRGMNPSSQESAARDKKLGELYAKRDAIMASNPELAAKVRKAEDNYRLVKFGGLQGDVFPRPLGGIPAGGLTLEQVDEYSRMTIEDIKRLNPAAVPSRPATQEELTGQAGKAPLSEADWKAAVKEKDLTTEQRGLLGTSYQDYLSMPSEAQQRGAISPASLSYKRLQDAGVIDAKGNLDALKA
ncbi:MAG: hypothetical protein PHQ43_09080, partial [Dehalococcoidales bacterium]|nr:hypothetical protein [Dehalococcoidales bacterium]